MEINGLSKSYNGTTVLDIDHLSIKTGRFYAIVAELLPWMSGNQFGNERLLLFSKLFLAGQMNYLSTSEDVLHFFPFVIVMSIIENSAECFLVIKKKEVF